MRHEQVPSLRTLIMGGEPVLATDIQTWAPHTRLLNMYGPAECTVVATANHCTATSSDNSGIGTALPSACTWIVDSNDHERLVPVGAVGELLIEGPIVARGYVKDLQAASRARCRRRLYSDVLQGRAKCDGGSGAIWLDEHEFGGIC